MAENPALCAVLVVGAPGDTTRASPLGEECPMHLTPLLGKTPLVYAVETLVACGIERIICLGWDEPVSSQKLLGDGRRWGCRIEWHSLSGPQHVFERMVDIVPAEGSFLLASTACLMLPELKPPGLTALAPGTLFVPPADPLAGSVSCKNGSWAWLDRALCAALADGPGWHEWHDAMAAVCTRRQAVPCLDLSDGGALLRAIPVMLRREFQVVIDGSEIEPGIFVSRNVVIHPTAQITAPVYAGADVVMGRHCRIGPSVAIGRRSHIGQDCEIVDAQLGPDSWLGASLDVNNSVVWRGMIWSQRHQARLPIVDAGLLSQGQARWMWRRALARQLGRLMAALLWLLLLPLTLCMVLIHGLGWQRAERLALVDPVRAHLADSTRLFTTWLGAQAQTRGWRHALGFVLPNLGGVVLGRWCLMGFRPRTPAQWAELPLDHQRWLAGRACGLIQEEWLINTAPDDALQSMVLERFQDMRANSLLYALGLIGRYACQLLRTSGPTFSSEKGEPQWN